MFVYMTREDSRKRFSGLANRNRLSSAGITAMRRIGPIRIVAGRRPRSIAVFVIRTTVLSARAAS
jgi:hypothetical protein